jgi:hypothetical protein
MEHDLAHDAMRANATAAGERDAAKKHHSTAEAVWSRRDKAAGVRARGTVTAFRAFRNQQFARSGRARNTVTVAIGTPPAQRSRFPRSGVLEW